MTMDFTRQQMNRGALISAFLDITLGQWMAGLGRLRDDEIPAELNEPLVMVVESLQTATRPDVGYETEIESRTAYLQGVASLSDDALKWTVQTFGTMPTDMIGS